MESSMDISIYDWTYNWFIDINIYLMKHIKRFNEKNMATIPTAKEQLLSLLSDLKQDSTVEYLIKKENIEELEFFSNKFIEFAEYHVQACKKEISNKNLLTDFAHEFLQEGAYDAIDKDLILQSYPSSNIK